jgi:hypothetical protein
LCKCSSLDRIHRKEFIKFRFFFTNDYILLTRIWFGSVFLLTLVFSTASCGGSPDELVVEKKVDSVSAKTQELEQWYEENKLVIRDKLYSIELMLGHVEELQNRDLNFPDWSEKDALGYLYFDYVFDSEDPQESDLGGGYWNWRREINAFLADTNFLKRGDYEDEADYDDRLSINKSYYERFLKLRYLLVITGTEYKKPIATYSDFRPGNYTGEFALVSLDSNCVLLRKTITATNSDEVTVYGPKNSMYTDADQRLIDDLKNNFLNPCYAAIEKKREDSSK